jgi:hypothetical protein
MKHFAQALVSLSVLATLTEARAEEIHQVAALPLGLDPTHLHLLTNHIPIFITLSGILALALAFLWKSDTAKRIALLLLFVGTVGGLGTFWLGQESYKPVRGLADETGQDWLDLHMERAEQVVWIFWLAAAFAMAAMVMVWKKTRFALITTLSAGILGTASLGAAGWIADAGGKIRHPEIRGHSLPVPVGMENESPSHQH